MAQPYVSLRRFTTFVTSLAETVNAKINTSAIKNNDTTTSSGYVADARIVKTHGDEIDTHTTQLGGLYFGTDDDGAWGYATTSAGDITPFRNPTGDATEADVLSGKIFSSADLEDAVGTMTNNGTYIYSSTSSETIDLEGYYASGSYIDTSGAYSAGHDSSTLTVVSLGTATSSNLTFDCTGIDGYESLTASNFALYVTGVSVSGGAVNANDASYPQFGTISSSCSPALSYDASTGTLTVSGMSCSNTSYNTNSTWYRYVSASVTAEVYCYYPA